MSLKKEQHEGFTKFFEKPTRDTLRDLIKENIGETDYLDFKAQWLKFPKLAKHILALANSGGGVLVIGIEQDNTGSLISKGIEEILDKDKIHKGIKNIIPENIEYVVFDFSYQESEYPTLKGKKFQVMMVEYLPQYIPFLTIKGSEGIKDNTVYVRRGTSSDEATHEELQKIINIRLETGHSTKHTLKLIDHLEQLKTLYKEIKPGYNLNATIGQLLALTTTNQYNEDYNKYIKRLIKQKKIKIENELEL